MWHISDVTEKKYQFHEVALNVLFTNNEEKKECNNPIKLPWKKMIQNILLKLCWNIWVERISGRRRVNSRIKR